jgi:hypothetical protein
MKVFLDKDSSDYIEVKNDNRGSVDLSIRTSSDLSSSIIITAKLNQDVLDKFIANLILLKSRALVEEE